MRYVKSRLKKDNEDEAYRIYVTDVLRIISGRDGLPRFYEMLHPENDDPPETAEEIIARTKAGVNKFGGG